MHGDQNEGEQLLRETIRSYPAYSTAYFYLGEYLKDRGRTDEARTLLEQSVELRPWAPAFVLLGHVYRYFKMDDEARQAFQRATVVDPEESDAWFGLGVLERYRDREQAIALLRKAIDLNPENGAALRELGHMLWRNGDLAAAEEHIRVAIRLNADDAWAHDYLGSILRWTDRDEEAEAEFRTAIELWPDQPLFHCNLGEILIRLGREREGERSFKDALALDTSYYLANLRMGQLLRDQGRSAAARLYLERALRSDPSDRRAREALATLPEESSDRARSDNPSDSNA